VSNTGSGPPRHVPTLTEVVTWPESTAAPATPAAQIEAQSVEAGVTDAPPPLLLPTARLAEQALIERVLVELQRQVDLMLEYRLREVLTPLLSRAAESVVRDARGELASTLRDMVSRALAQELTRHRTR
jgi:hypothetical protein